MTRETEQRWPSFEAFAEVAGIRLRRALVARFGPDLGAEAAADAMAYAWRHWDTLASMANPVGYLYRVGQTSVRTQTRWRRRRAAYPVETEWNDTVHLPDPGLHRALERLSPDHRAAVILVHAHGYSYEEAARTLNIPVTTVRNHLHRGMVKLRSLLEQP